MAKRKATGTAKGKAKGQKRAPKETKKGASWFRRGQDGLDRKKEKDHEAELAREKWIRRFHLKAKPGPEGKDNKARIIFLDREPGFYVDEHVIFQDKRLFYLTCTKDFGPCPVCEGVQNKSIYTAYYTVIDTRSYTRNDGSVSKFRKCMFPAKGAAQEKLEKIRKAKGTLRGLAIDVERMGEKDPNCGRDFDVAGRYKEAKLVEKFEDGLKEAKQDLEPYNYEVILEPPTDDELKAVRISPTHYAGSADDIVDDDDEEVEDDSFDEEEASELLDE